MTPITTSPDHSASPRRSLDAERTDQLRTFLTAEAAASTRRPVLTPARRRLAIGTATAVLLAGGLVAVQSVGGPAPSAIAVEVEGEWTTIRLVDIDADPDAVVRQLRDAGFDAERQPLEVERAGDGATITHRVDDPAPGAGGVIGVGTVGEGGTHGLVGLSVDLPAGALPDEAVPADEAPTTGTAEADGEGDGPETSGPAPDDALAEAGVRFEADGGISVRAGAEVTIVVHTER